MKCKRCNIKLEFDNDYCENCQDKIVERVKAKYGVYLDDCSTSEIIDLIAKLDKKLTR